MEYLLLSEFVDFLFKEIEKELFIRMFLFILKSAQKEKNSEMKQFNVL